MIRRPPRSTQSRSSAASDVYKRQLPGLPCHPGGDPGLAGGERGDHGDLRLRADPGRGARAHRRRRPGGQHLPSADRVAPIRGRAQRRGRGAAPADGAGADRAGRRRQGARPEARLVLMGAGRWWVLPPPAPTKGGVMTVNTAVPSAGIAQAPVRRLRGGISGGWRGASANQLFLVPIAAVFLVLFIIPLGQTFYWSLTDFTGYSADVTFVAVSYTHLRAHETRHDLVCRLLLEKKKT